MDSNHTVVFSEQIGSDAMRWCFYWATNGDLWAYSSDTGYLKEITPDANGPTHSRNVSKGERLPQAVYDFLPSSLRVGFGN
jgi:hypothetical protein